ncbi:5'-_3' exoribonuclease [Anaeramoeba flamelloides]|nr:5'->3' exoribonuclease [Anaeramoeba flamelloides]
MGVPQFFKWLAQRYPLVLKKISEHKIPEIDNLYLDFNGIIHKATHPESHENDITYIKPEEEMIKDIFINLSNLVDVIKPKKLLFISIDGVA